jgi:hypothetical protein
LVVVTEHRMINAIFGPEVFQCINIAIAQDDLNKVLNDLFVWGINHAESLLNFMMIF